MSPILQVSVRQPANNVLVLRVVLARDRRCVLPPLYEPCEDQQRDGNHQYPFDASTLLMGQSFASALTDDYVCQDAAAGKKEAGKELV
jgi:hypothetical protein